MYGIIIEMCIASGTNGTSRNCYVVENNRRSHELLERDMRAEAEGFYVEIPSGSRINSVRVGRIRNKCA